MKPLSIINVISNQPLAAEFRARAPCRGVVRPAADAPRPLQPGAGPAAAARRAARRDADLPPAGVAPRRPRRRPARRPLARRGAEAAAAVAVAAAAPLVAGVSRGRCRRRRGAEGARLLGRPRPRRRPADGGGQRHRRRRHHRAAETRWDDRTP